MNKILAGMIVACATAVHAAGSVNVPRGYMNGNAYQSFSDLEKRRYVTGVVDGLLMAPIMAMKDTPRAIRLQSCEINHQMTDSQLVAIVDKYMAEHPESWGDDMAGLIFRSIRAACATVGSPLD
ncbi:Rap1a/Tai family immunity protein [Ralstonia sp. VS2407]